MGPRLVSAPGAVVRTSVQPLACTQLPPVTYNPGKPGLTISDIQEALRDSNNPLGQVRGVVGDTTTTRGQVAAYAAARVGLGCKY